MSAQSEMFGATKPAAVKRRVAEPVAPMPRTPAAIPLATLAYGELYLLRNVKLGACVIRNETCSRGHELVPHAHTLVEIGGPRVWKVECCECRRERRGVSDDE